MAERFDVYRSLGEILDAQLAMLSDGKLPAGIGIVTADQLFGRAPKKLSRRINSLGGLPKSRHGGSTLWEGSQKVVTANQLFGRAPKKSSRRINSLGGLPKSRVSEG